MARLISRCGILAAFCGLATGVLACPPESGGDKAPAAAMGIVRGDDPVAQARPAVKPVVQIAILLDTSNSMDGLIAQTKSQLWSIVNVLATAKHSGERPELRVALYEYGKQTLEAQGGFIRQILPLTTDLDEVSAQLFALTTNGGDEFCGHVIQAAAQGLDWSPRPQDLKIILIAGNEPFTQGGVDYHQSVPAAVRKGIVVNTIFCGGEQEGVSTNWKDGALLGEGSYSFIDTNAAAVHIASPFDDEITTLSANLNKTYVGYGAQGESGHARQSVQDSNAAAAAPGAAVQRAVTKSGEMYRNSRWDLVDAVKEKSVKLEEMKDEELPQIMRDMTREQRAEYVARMTSDRDETQKKIADLNQKREAFVQAEQARQAAQAKTDGKTLESAVIGAIRTQAVQRGYTFDK